MTRIQRRGRRLRFQGLAVGTGLGIAISGSALALSLGAPQTHSFLTEPLLLRLPLRLEAQDADPAQLQVRLLPASAYAALGYPVPGHAIADLQAAIVGNAENGYWVSIRSNHALREPVLSLLVELRSPGSSWIRGIDLLLDPPPANLMAPHAAAMVAAQRAAPAQRKLERPLAPPGLRTIGPARYYGPVRPGESLSRIAQRVRQDASVPLHEVISTLYETNRAAFDGSPGRLRVGSTLLVPDGVAGVSATAATSRPSHNLDPAVAPAASTATALHYLEGPLFGLELQLASRPAASVDTAWPTRFRLDWTQRLKPTTGEAAQAATELGPEPIVEDAPAAGPAPELSAPAASAAEPALVAPLATDAWQTAGDVMREPELAAAPAPETLPAAPPAPPPTASVPVVQDPADRLAWQWPALALLLFIALLSRWRRRAAEQAERARRTASYRRSAVPPQANRSLSAGPAVAPPRPNTPEPPAAGKPQAPVEEDFAERAARTQIDPMMDTIVTQATELEFDFPLDEEEMRTALSAELEDIEQEQDAQHGSRLSSLHLRLTALLADEPDATVRRDAKLALACLDGGDADQAEAIVLRLEAGNSSSAEADTGEPGKIVEFPRQQRQS